MTATAAIPAQEQPRQSEPFKPQRHGYVPDGSGRRWAHDGSYIGHHGIEGPPAQCTEQRLRDIRFFHRETASGLRELLGRMRQFLFDHTANVPPEVIPRYDARHLWPGERHLRWLYSHLGDPPAMKDLPFLMDLPAAIKQVEQLLAYHEKEAEQLSSVPGRQLAFSV